MKYKCPQNGREVQDCEINPECVRLNKSVFLDIVILMSCYIVFKQFCCYVL